jgi:hypothetical protein
VPPAVGAINVDSSEMAGTEVQPGSLLLLGGLAVVVVVSVAVIIWRNVRSAPLGAPTKFSQ